MWPFPHANARGQGPRSGDSPMNGGTFGHSSPGGHGADLHELVSQCRIGGVEEVHPALGGLVHDGEPGRLVALQPERHRPQAKP